MVNNIGKITQTLNTELGTTNSFSSSDDITFIAGQLGSGLLLFDPVGTIGVVSNVSEEGFTVTTHARSLNLKTLLTANY